MMKVHVTDDAKICYAKQEPLPDDLVKHIKNVVNFFWENQLNDAVEFVRSGNNVRNHVFSDIVELDNVLGKTKNKAEDLVEDYLEVSSWRL